MPIIKTISYAVVIYVLLMLVLSQKFDGYTLYQYVISYMHQPGGGGHTCERYREIDHYKDIDILFVGSSHVYRGFDPRIFREKGYSVFNMGTSSQSPLNSYFLLKNYFHILKPKLVIMELYPIILTLNGKESAFDIISNVPLSLETLNMALAVRDVQALNLLLVKFIDTHVFGNRYIQQYVPGEAYVSGGYSETLLKKTRVTPSIKDKTTLTVNARQIDYLEEIVRFVQQQNCKIVFIIQPVTEMHEKSFDNYREVIGRTSEIAGKYSVDMLDFGQTMKLDSDKHFLDDDHLNQQGVALFNSRVIRYLEESRVLH